MVTYSIEKLSRLSDTSKRSIRFYVYEGLLSKPEGNTRGASYTQHHLERLLYIKRMSDRGFTLKQIRHQLELDGTQEIPEPIVGSVDVLSRIYLGNGIELMIDVSKAHLSGKQIRHLARDTLKNLHTIRQQPSY